jgi:hypothetical protein
VILEKFWVRLLSGGSQAHRFATPALWQFLRLTTPTSMVLYFALLLLLAYLLNHQPDPAVCPPEIPPLPLLSGGHVVVVLPYLFLGISSGGDTPCLTCVCCPVCSTHDACAACVTAVFALAPDEGVPSGRSVRLHVGARTFEGGCLPPEHTAGDYASFTTCYHARLIPLLSGRIQMGSNHPRENRGHGRAPARMAVPR